VTPTNRTDASFTTQWNALERRERLRLRRLARLGRPADDSRQAALLVEYARFQRTRFWARLFWVWFIPGVIVALGIAARIHPLLIGVVLALSAQAVLTWWNLRRAEKINVALVG
jgi:hypothetical protein